jgi:hypothetical protein
VHAQGASPALHVLFAARTCVSPARRRRGVENGTGAEPARRFGLPGNEGRAAHEAAFRIEPRAPASPLGAARLR